MKLEKTLVLVGLMGAGKSTIGRRLAKMLHVPFKDSDDEISEAAGCSISDIFYIHGEEIFRDLEKRVMTRLLTDGKPKILATGGGAWMHKEVRDLTKKHAQSLWLRADIPVLLERVSKKNTRPILEQGDKAAILTKMQLERAPFYEQADMIIDSDHGDHEVVVKKIAQLISPDDEKLVQPL
jgi:shikimate kinase